MHDALPQGKKYCSVFTASLTSSTYSAQGFVTRNINCGIEESLQRFEDVCSAAKRDGVRVRG